MEFYRTFNDVEDKMWYLNHEIGRFMEHEKLKIGDQWHCLHCLSSYPVEQFRAGCNKPSGPMTPISKWEMLLCPNHPDCDGTLIDARFDQPWVL